MLIVWMVCTQRVATTPPESMIAMRPSTTLPMPSDDYVQR
jgi:hypothetical protein